MAIEEPTLESFECEEYARLISNPGPWRCILCNLTETLLYLNRAEGYFVWHRFGLSCRRKHEVHPYCYRKWCKEKGAVGCPRCGEIPYDKANKCCMKCNEFECECTA